jgi:hypothetical protein
MSKAMHLHYDGRLYWYTEWFDPAADLCCLCRQPIPEDDVPLILFKTVGRQTWQCRLHMDPCGQTLIASGALAIDREEGR